MTVGVPCEVYSRIVGYFRPISQWNAGQREQYLERKGLKIDENDLSCDET
jgi:anaerobic ribonucleoside-triphosphate reductase